MKFLEFLGKIWEKVWGLVLGVVLAVVIRAIVSPWIPFMGYSELFRLLGEHIFSGLQLTGFAVREIIFFTLFAFLYLYLGKIVSISLSRRVKVIVTCLLLVAVVAIAFHLYPAYSKGVAIRIERETKAAALKAKEAADQLARGPKVFRDSQQKVADREYRDNEFEAHKKWSDDKASPIPEVREKASENKFWRHMKDIGDWFRDAWTAFWLLARWFFKSTIIRFLLVALILMYFLGKKIAWCEKAGFVLVGLILIFTVLGFMGGGDYKKESVATPFSELMRKVPLVGGIFFPPPPPPPLLTEIGYTLLPVAGIEWGNRKISINSVPSDLPLWYADRGTRQLGDRVHSGIGGRPIGGYPLFVWVLNEDALKLSPTRPKQLGIQIDNGVITAPKGLKEVMYSTY